MSSPAELLPDDAIVLKPDLKPEGPYTVLLTQKALQEISRLRGSSQQGLKIAVVGGGCSGMSYKLDFKDAPAEKDKEFHFQGVRVWVDPKSFLYINGLTLDFSDGLNGKGFVFINPNAKRSCGCGSSFSA